jgi:hypothetical protein
LQIREGENACATLRGGSGNGASRREQKGESAVLYDSKMQSQTHVEIKDSFERNRALTQVLRD